MTTTRVREVSFSQTEFRGPRPSYDHGKQVSQSCYAVGASSCDETSDADSNYSLPAEPPRARLYRAREQSNMSIGRMGADSQRRPPRFRERLGSRRTTNTQGQRSSSTTNQPTGNSTSLHALDASSRTLVENWEEYDFVTLCCHLKPWGKAIVVFDIIRAFSTIAAAFFILQDVANQCEEKNKLFTQFRRPHKTTTGTTASPPLLISTITGDLGLELSTISSDNPVTTASPASAVDCLGMPEWLLGIAAAISTVCLMTSLLASLAIFRGYKSALATPHCVTSVFLVIFFVVSPLVLLLNPPREDRKQMKAVISGGLFVCALVQLVITYLLFNLLYYLRLKRHYFKAIQEADWDFSRISHPEEEH